MGAEQRIVESTGSDHPQLRIMVGVEHVQVVQGRDQGNDSGTKNDRLQAVTAVFDQQGTAREQHEQVQRGFEQAENALLGVAPDQAEHGPGSKQQEACDQRFTQDVPEFFGPQDKGNQGRNAEQPVIQFVMQASSRQKIKVG